MFEGSPLRIIMAIEKLIEEEGRAFFQDQAKKYGSNGLPGYSSYASPRANQSLMIKLILFLYMFCRFTFVYL